MSDTNQLARLIEEKRGHGVDLGSAEDGPSDEWIAKAEQRLGCKLPESYIWFLKNYGGGEVFGNEVFSIYCIDFDSANGGDIVFQHLVQQKAGTLSAKEIPLMQTDFGEVFYFDAGSPGAEGEYPVGVKRGSDRQEYASSFEQFLTKLITEG